MPSSNIKYTALEEYMAAIRRHVKVETDVDELPLHSLTGRMLAEDISSQVDLPPHPKSLVDGYAVKTEDTVAASEDHPVNLKLILGRIELEKTPETAVKRGEACYIPTGGFMPDGADASVKVEDAEVADGLVMLKRRVQVGEHVTPAGGDVLKGEVVFKRGRRLRPEDLALLAALDVLRARVVRRPRVAVLSVGDELTDRFEEADVKKFAGISLTVAGLVAEAGGEPVSLGVARDDEEDIRSKIRAGLDSADAVLTIGGTSRGVKDLVANAINRAGQPGLLFHGLDVAPGRVSGLGVVEGKPVVMLPGLIQSTAAAFYLIALPAIRRLCGFEPEPALQQIRLPVAEDVPLHTPALRKLIFIRLTTREDRTVAQPLSKLGEASVMKPVADADGFTIIPEGLTTVRKGEYVTVNLLHT